MHIVLAKGTGVVSKLIEWQTRGQYSHAILLFSDGVAIEAKEFVGVHQFQYQIDPAHDVFNVTLPVDEVAARKFAAAQVGKGYDYTMVARFVTRKQANRSQSNKWFCSELVFATMLEGGVRLLDRIEPWAVSPEILSLSPFLEHA